MRSLRCLTYGFCLAIFIGLLYPNPPSLSLAQVNPCAAKNPCSVNPCAVTNPCAARNPCAVKNPCAVNPCAVKNPCAAVNPCAPGSRVAAPIAKAIMARGTVARVNPSSRMLVLQSNGKRLSLTLGKYSIVRQGPKVKTVEQIKPGDKVTVSYVDSGRKRTAWYIYLASAAPVANPCAANPCAARNPCAAKNPCAARNPCVANPCAAK